MPDICDFMNAVQLFHQLIRRNWIQKSDCLVDNGLKFVGDYDTADWLIGNKIEWLASDSEGSSTQPFWRRPNIILAFSLKWQSFEICWAPFKIESALWKQLKFASVRFWEQVSDMVELSNYTYPSRAYGPYRWEVYTRVSKMQSSDGIDGSSATLWNLLRKLTTEHGNLAIIDKSSVFWHK